MSQPLCSPTAETGHPTDAGVNAATSGGLRRGDVVEVRSASEIAETLDENGTLDQLPFMTEMAAYYGKRYTVYRRVVQVVIDGAALDMNGESRVREFKNNDVVLLEGARCAGLAHGGCQRGCMIFWKEAWLRKVEPGAGPALSTAPAMEMLLPRLVSSTETSGYFCQSSEFRKATNSLSYGQRFKKCFENVSAGNQGWGETAKQLVVWAFWKIRDKLLGPFPRGKMKPTPVERLDLQPGEIVEVKTLPEIIATLDKNGRNRGLHFSADMRLYCGKRFRVRSRADKLITEGTGQLRGIPNTVVLEGIVCDSAYYAFGGCPRDDFQYWREIWLRRVAPNN